MKKLLLTASILAVSAGNAFAQSAAPTAPVNNHTVGFQLSEIVQTGNSNVAVADQKLSEEGISDINQTGNNHNAEVTQVETNGGSNFFGFGSNIADINQQGDFAKAVINQTNDNPGVLSNTAVIDQNALNGVIAAAVTLDGTIMQSGAQNQSSITQTGDFALMLSDPGLTALNDQSGTTNLSQIDQDGGAVAFSVTDVTVTQIGDTNDSRVGQLGGNLVANVTQNGVGNLSEVDQESLADAGQTATVNQFSMDSSSFITQTGTAQIAELDQGGINNVSHITQSDGLLGGTGSNFADVSQSTDDNLSTILQEGTSNMAFVNQDVTSGNVSNITQFGDSNMATVNQ